MFCHIKVLKTLDPGIYLAQLVNDNGELRWIMREKQVELGPTSNCVPFKAPISPHRDL